jgi:hypothetical protein
MTFNLNVAIPVVYLLVRIMFTNRFSIDHNLVYTTPHPQATRSPHAQTNLPRCARAAPLHQAARQSTRSPVRRPPRPFLHRSTRPPGPEGDPARAPFDTSPRATAGPSPRALVDPLPCCLHRILRLPAPGRGRLLGDCPQSADDGGVEAGELLASSPRAPAQLRITQGGPQVPSHWQPGGGPSQARGPPCRPGDQVTRHPGCSDLLSGMLRPKPKWLDCFSFLVSLCLDSMASYTGI